MKANSKHYILIVLGLVTIGLTVFGYWYVYKTTISQAEKYSLLLQDIKNNEQNNKQELKLLEVSSSTLSRRSTLSSYFVSDDKVLDFIKSIENIAVESSTELVLSGVAADDLSGMEVGSTGHIRLHVDVRGNWTNVNKALVLIENLPYNISIDSISMTANTSEGLSADKKTAIKKSTWAMNFNVSALTMK